MSVVLVIGKFLRASIAHLHEQLIINEILHPQPLLDLCHDISLARDYKNFKLEEILVGKLFFIYRIAASIVELTEGAKKIVKPKRD